jgi:hypothetical protein
MTTAPFPHCLTCATPDACETADRCRVECPDCITPPACAKLGCRKRIPEAGRHFAAHAAALGEPQPPLPSTGEPPRAHVSISPEIEHEAGDALSQLTGAAEAWAALPPRARILREAERLICGDREADYGPPAASFARTAALWSAYLGQPVTAAQVCDCLALLKLARLSHDAGHADSRKDACGYLALGGEVVA